MAEPAKLNNSVTGASVVPHENGSAAPRAAEKADSSAPADREHDGRKNHRDNGRGQGRRGRGRGRGGRGGRGDSKGGHSAMTDRRKLHESKRRRRDDRGNTAATAADGESDPAAKKSNMSIPFTAEEIAAEDRLPKRKVAVLIGYAGTGYKGMQINHHEKTIEGDLFAAFVGAGAIAKRNADDPKKSSFVRCARTDKGVHAAGNVISLKLTIEDPDIVQKINEKLPEQIRVWGFTRTNNAFNCYQACDSRWYEYLLPSYTLLPPHPQTFLGKKVTEAAKEKGVYEDCLKSWDDVKDYWDEVEKNEIQPILDRLDEKTREEVQRLMHAAEDPNSQAGGQEEAAEQEPAVEDAVGQDRSKKRKAEEDAEDAEDAAIKKARTEGESTEQTAENSQVQPEPTINAAEVGTKPADGDTSSAKADEATTAPKSKYQATPAEVALKEIKAAYIAAKRRYRVTPGRIQQLQSALDMYKGTNNFHNYTIQKTFKDPSAKRHIRSFVVNPNPIQIRDTEWLSLKVHGQSFMMHQIRKMVAMAVLCVRCAVPIERIKESYGPKRISIPKAPGLGLLLERPVFETYSKKAKDSFGKDALDFSKYEKEIEEFKHKQIYNRIWDTEESEASFHVFLHQLDSFNTDYFLWVTAHGIEGAYEPKERRDPKQKAALNALEEELVGSDEEQPGQGEGGEG